MKGYWRTKSIPCDKRSKLPVSANQAAYLPRKFAGASLFSFQTAICSPSAEVLAFHGQLRGNLRKISNF